MRGYRAGSGRPRIRVRVGVVFGGGELSAFLLGERVGVGAWGECVGVGFWWWGRRVRWGGGLGAGGVGSGVGAGVGVVFGGGELSAFLLGERVGVGAWGECVGVGFWWWGRRVRWGGGLGAGGVGSGVGVRVGVVFGGGELSAFLLGERVGVGAWGECVGVGFWWWGRRVRWGGGLGAGGVGSGVGVRVGVVFGGGELSAFLLRERVGVGGLPRAGPERIGGAQHRMGVGVRVRRWWPGRRRGVGVRAGSR